MICNKSQPTTQTTDTAIGAEGAQALSLALAKNKTLRVVELQGRFHFKKNPIGSRANKNQQTDNAVGDKGAVALGEALKLNTSLVCLCLWSENAAYHQDTFWWKHEYSEIRGMTR